MSVPAYANRVHGQLLKLMHLQSDCEAAVEVAHLVPLRIEDDLNRPRRSRRIRFGSAVFDDTALYDRYTRKRAKPLNNLSTAASGLTTGFFDFSLKCGWHAVGCHI